jgi:transcriptional regulator with XRE-family HTH domain
VENRRTLGRTLRALLKAQGYPSVERFAYENGFSKSWLGKVMAGQVEPGFYKVVRIAKALEVTLEDLYPMKKRRK